MASSIETIIKHHKQEYLVLISKQKTAILDRFKQESHMYISIDSNGAQLLSLSDQPIHRPSKVKVEEIAPMTDEDFLVAELNGGFQ